MIYNAYNAIQTFGRILIYHACGHVHRTLFKIIIILKQTIRIKYFIVFLFLYVRTVSIINRKKNKNNTNTNNLNNLIVMHSLTISIKKKMKRFIYY